MELIHNIKSLSFGIFDFLKILQKLGNVLSFRKCFGMFDVFVKVIVIFNIGFGFVVLKSIWWHGLKLFLDIFPSSSVVVRRRRPSSSSSSVVVVVVRRRRRPSSSSSSSSSVVVVLRRRLGFEGVSRA